ncbi:MAG: rhomboid family intramembrane serine protease [Lysobacterales bacterium]
MPPLTPVTRALLVAMVLGFLLQQWRGEVVLAWFALWPFDLDHTISASGEPFRLAFHWWQMLTYALLHGNFIHLMFNGIALGSFGGAVAHRLGARRFLLFFALCVIGSAVAQLLTLPASGSGQPLTPTVGASGGIYGVLIAFAFFFPRARMMLIFPPIPMPAWLLVLLFIGADLALGLGRVSTGIAHFAHLGGALTGVLLLLLWRRDHQNHSPRSAM